MTLWHPTSRHFVVVAEYTPTLLRLSFSRSRPFPTATVHTHTAPTPSSPHPLCVWAHGFVHGVGAYKDGNDIERNEVDDAPIGGCCHKPFHQDVPIVHNLPTPSPSIPCKTVHACVRACVRACVHACVRALTCVRTHECMRWCMHAWRICGGSRSSSRVRLGGQVV